LILKDRQQQDKPRLDFARHFLLLCPKALPGREAQVFHQATCLVGIVTSLVIGLEIALFLRRTIRGKVIQMHDRVMPTAPM
jgi:hypothetical protein